MARSSGYQELLEKQKAFQRKWLLNPATVSMKDDDEREIADLIRNDAPASWLMVSDRLARLTAWHGARGQAKLMAGEPSGWTDIHRSFLYESLALRIRISMFQKGRVLGQFRSVKSLETEASASALCLAYAMVVHRDFEAGFFGNAVRAMLLDKNIVREAYWEYHYTEAFVVQLLALSRNENCDVVKDMRRGLGVYQAIIDAWKNPSSMAKAISGACDFHCERIEDKSGRFSAEFRGPPFDLVPAEILAIYAVRRSLGLDTPPVDHPLLESPFHAPPGSPTDIEDGLLEEVEARVG